MMLFLTISDTKNQETQRKRLNALFAVYSPGYGSALPDAADSPDGRLFYIGSQGYQNRSGAWVAL
jgi:hypothetical protein